jgi:hypothetical protein
MKLVVGAFYWGRFEYELNMKFGGGVHSIEEDSNMG